MVCSERIGENKMTIRDVLNVLAGICIQACVYALYTDKLGLENYIKYLRSSKGWMDEKYSIPLYTCLLILNVVFIFINNDIKFIKR